MPLGMFSVPDPELRPDETRVDEWPANRTQNRRRAVGGRLFLTDRRLLFVPNEFDASLAGRGFATSLDGVAAVGTRPGKLSPNLLDTLFGGGIRTRLRVETHDGDVELFVVSDPGAVARRVRAATER